MKTKLLLLLLLANFSIYAQTNLVSNGDFETWTPSSQPTDWFRFSNGLLYQDSNAQNGSSSTKMEITSGTLHFMNSSPFAIQSGKTYRVTMYHKLVSGTFSSIELSLTKSDVFKTTITKKTETTTVNSEWRKIEFDYAATTSQNAEISIWVIGTTGSQILVDNVSIVDVAEIGPKYTLIPDVNFENALIGLGIDSGTADGKVLTSKVATVNSLYISSKNITDLTGIQDFKALTLLSCFSNQLTSVDVSNNAYLTILNIDSNKITNLDISKNPKLSELTCDDNKLTSLDLSFTPLLTELSLNSNPVTSLNLSNVKFLRRLSFYNSMITSIDLSNNKVLTSLLADRNKLTTLNVSENKELIHLSCSTNLLTALDVSANTKLEYLDFSSNAITSIDLKFNTNLKALVCYTNKLSVLDLSNNKFLIGLDCENNTNLTELNLKNGNNTNLLKKYTYITGTRGGPAVSSFVNNLKLSCIKVDDVAYSNANWSTLTDTPILFTLDCASLVYTLIPDANFEIKLIALGIDKDGKNGKVLTSSINSVTSLNVSKSNIADLTGIQDFTALTILNCSENALTTLDVSANINLKTLTANKNQLKSINTSKNTALESFTGSNNQFTTLDFSANTALLRVYVTDNVLTSLNVNSNSKLTTLWCQRNKLPNLEVSKNLGLTEFVCDRNELEILDVSKNIGLVSFSCSENKLKSLDVSLHPSLKIFNCSINKLETLNLKNGNNTLLDKANLAFFSNLNLKCILVDDPQYSNTNWSALKDASASYNTDCTVYTLIPDANFEDKLIALQIDKDGKNGKVVTTSISNLTSLDVSKSNIANLTGIQDFTSLTQLIASENILTTLDLSSNTKLKNLQVQTNQLATLNVSKNIALTTLACYANKLTVLNVAPLTALENLACSGNNLSALNVDSNLALTSLNCGNNMLTTINVSKNVALVNFYCHTNKITSLDVSNNILLQNFMCNGNNLTVLNVSKNPALVMLDCLDNQITSLDISKNPKITELACQNNQLTSLNLKNGNNIKLDLTYSNFKNNPKLTCIQVDNEAYSIANWSAIKDAAANYNLDCATYTLIPDVAFEDKLIALQIDIDGKNGKVLTSSIASVKDLNVQLSDIKDLTGIQDFAALEFLNCQFNFLTSLNVTKNSKLTELYTHGNDLTTLDVSANTALTTLQANKNKLTALDISKNSKLVYVNVSENALKTLNLKNGNNTNFTTAFMFKNPGLSCILVDNASFATSSIVFSKDASASYSTTCTLGIEDSVFDKVVLYPNPTKGEVHINNITLEKATVYNSLGQLVKTFVFNGDTNNTINLSGLPRGIYYVYLINEDAASAKKVIVE
jgi:Leucine-rich repeat (LRR) protein